MKGGLKEKALTFTSTESKVRKLPFCILAAKSFLSTVHTSILILKSQKYEGGTLAVYTVADASVNNYLRRTV